MFNLATGAAGAFASYILLGMQADTRQQRQNLENLIKELPETYARRDDTHRIFDEIKSALTRIESRQIGHHDG